MKFGENSYERIAGFLKLALPVTALALLGVVAVWPFMEKRDLPTVVSDELARETVRDVRVFDARYRDITEGGVSFILTAEQTIQDSIDAPLVSLVAPRAAASWIDGRRYDVRADKGRMDRRTGSLELWGNVRAVRNDGYSFMTEDVKMNMARRDGEGDAPVQINGPGLKISAEGGFGFYDMGARVELRGKSKIMFDSGETPPAERAE